MRILILSSLYPPASSGGAEDCAQSFALWAAANGHAVAVVTAALSPEEERTERLDRGVDIFSIPAPHILPITTVRQGAKWLKPLWHLQDHFSREAEDDIERVIAAFRPDVVMVHYLQGFGYRMIPAIAGAGVPIVYVLHDLGLACYRMSLFKNGANCRGHCLPCRGSAWFKEGLLERADRAAAVGLISPSRANLDTLGRYFPVSKFRRTVILNTKSYPSPTVARVASDRLRLLFAGKLESAKGIDILLEAVEALVEQEQLPISVTVAGTGSLEAALHARYGDADWCRFTGFVDQQTLANEMVASDLLCVPSIWQENSPGVIIQALATTLPVVGSNRGGIPELVEHGNNGFLLDGSREGWMATLRGAVSHPEMLDAMRRTCAEQAERFDQDMIGAETIRFMETVIASADGKQRCTKGPDIDAR